MAAIRNNLAESAGFEGSHTAHHSGRGVEQTVSGNNVHAEPTHEVNIHEFCVNLKAVGGNVKVVSGRSELAGVLRSLIEQFHPVRIAVSDSHLVSAAVSAIPVKSDVLQNAAPNELFECGLGVTEAQWGIAETGTLVLESEKEVSRLTSLVPDVHICILPATRIRSTMGEILQKLEERLSPTVTFITGASRTSDIELTLAIGVHGPRELHVILVEDV